MVEKIVRAPMGFLAGATYPLRAVRFILGHPSVWLYCIMPLLINIGVAVGVYIWIDSYSDAWFQTHLLGDSWYMVALRKVSEWLAVVLQLLAFVVSLVVVGSIAAVPFNDFLSERTDTIVTGWRDLSPQGIAAKAGALVITMLQEVKRLSTYLVLALLLFALSFIPVLTPFTTVAQLFLAASFLALEYLSYPLERRKVLLVRDKKTFARQHSTTTLGFGAAMAFMAFIPLVNFLFIPLGVVGGTLLFADLTRTRKMKGRGMDLLEAQGVGRGAPQPATLQENPRRAAAAPPPPPPSA